MGQVKQDLMGLTHSRCTWAEFSRWKGCTL